MKVQLTQLIKNRRGGVAIYVTLLLPFLIMVAALAIDVNHVYGVRNELQNAADAGALAGASDLFDDNGILTVDAAEDAARQFTTSNNTGTDKVADPIVEIGHWSFTSGEFTHMPGVTEQADWQGQSAQDIDENVNFINAVRVETTRSDTPSFFGKIFGVKQLEVKADAVAWIGFASNLFPNEVDWPIAICYEAITVDGVFQCDMGRMLNSGGNIDTAMTAMWTNYSQNPCSTASNSDMQGITGGCNAGNPSEIYGGTGMGTQNGVQDNIFSNLVDCWIAETDTDDDGIPDELWPLVLPVVRCSSSNTCATYETAVQVNIPWIIYKNDPLMEEVPRKMGDWSCSAETEPLDCWKSFVDHFNLENASGQPVTDADYQEMYQKKNIFFLTECGEVEPRGTGGTQPMAVPADVPVLVE